MSQIIYRDKQHAFDAACKHLRKMKERAVDDEGLCIYYYKKNGKVCRCAIGGIMTIDQAKRLKNNFKSIDWIVTALIPNSDIKERFSRVPSDFLGELQTLHDARENWGPEGIHESAIRKFAHQHNLIYTP